MPGPIPEGYHTATPFLTLKDCARAIEFYKQALGAVEEEVVRTPDGSVMHAEIRVGDSVFMLVDEMEGSPTKSPETVGSSYGFYLYVEDADRAFRRAVDAGAQVYQPVQGAFWGDRFGQVVDPFGIYWTFATRQVDLTREQRAQAAAKAFSGQARG